MVCYIIGISFVLRGRLLITGAFIGSNEEDFKAILGFILIISSIFLFVAKNNLENMVQRHNWQTYPITQKGLIEDLKLKYIIIEPNPKEKLRTAIQEKIETAITQKGVIDDKRINQRESYNQQFYEGHAAMGGRVIDLESHIAKNGKKKGKLIHFSKPANGEYIWVVDSQGNFI